MVYYIWLTTLLRAQTVWRQMMGYPCLATGRNSEAILLVLRQCKAKVNEALRHEGMGEWRYSSTILFFSMSSNLHTWAVS
jgi:hypothetical protein